MNIWRILYANAPGHSTTVTREWFATKGEATTRQRELKDGGSYPSLREFDIGRGKLTRERLVSFLNHDLPND